MVESFDDRGQAFETKEALSAEQKFKLRARRNRTLAEWVSGLLKHDATQAEAYIKQVIASDFEEAGDDDVLRKVYADLEQAGVAITEQEVRMKMDAMLEEIVADAEESAE